MAQLPDYENPTFPEVYELAEDDPVAGGPDGVDNLPHKQLKERTDYLRRELEKTSGSIGGVADRVLTLEASSAGSVGRAVPLSWEYGDKGFDFELFSAGFEWRDMDAVDVIQTVAGDESIDVSSTEQLEIGGTYVIYTSTGVAHTVTVASILSPVRFRAVQEMNVSLSGATLSRTSWRIEPGQATAPDQGVFYTRALKALRYYADGRVVIRRGDGDGSLELQYRKAGTTTWSDAILLRTLSRAEKTRDEEWKVEGGYDIELRIAASHGESGDDVIVHHMVAFPGEQAGRAFDVAQPTNVAPGDEATGLTDSLTLEGSTYRSLYGLAQADAEFRVGTEQEMSNVVYTALTGAPATSHQVEAGHLSTNSVYFWQLRYQDSDGTWSPWSEPTAFSTGSVFQYIQQPINTSPAAGASAASAVPTLQATKFKIVGGSDTHAASQWQVATDSNFSNIIHDSGETVTDLTSHKVPAGALQDQQQYYFRVRYKGQALGFSPYSKGTAFTTQAVPSAPSITAPADGATNVSAVPTIQTTSFFIPGGSDSHAKSQYQIARDSGFTDVVYDSGETADLTSHTLPEANALDALDTYCVRARHRGLASGFGAWSSPSSFTVKAPVGEATFTTVGSHEWTVPAGVTEVSVVAIGGGGSGESAGSTSGVNGGGGGALCYINSHSVQSGDVISVVVGAGGSRTDESDDGRGNPGGTSSFGDVISAGGGSRGYSGGKGGTYNGGTGYSGGNGGLGSGSYSGGGGGAAGYARPGGDGDYSTDIGPGVGGDDGGLGGGGRQGGGGVSLRNGQGGNDGGSSYAEPATYGNYLNGGDGGTFGGGGGGAGPNQQAGGKGGRGGQGAVRIIWGPGRSFPYNAG